MLTAESDRLQKSHKALVAAEAQIDSGVRRFRTFVDVERAGRQRQLQRRRALASSRAARQEVADKASKAASRVHLILTIAHHPDPNPTR